MSAGDTIFALATPPGKSGVAIIRLSGSRAFAAVRSLSGLGELPPRLAQFAVFRDGNGTVIDQGLALAFPAPRSFTGEDVAELQLHGSLAVIREMFALLSAMDGIRPAEAGEFSRRAFLNGKMDLMEAEGLADLIAAETSAQKAQALAQMQGAASRHYEALRMQAITCLAHLETLIDFPDEDIPDSVLQGIGGDIARLRANIETLLDDGKRGERLREGIDIAILGAPNAGKSSLLNMLAGREAAIVSTQAGTTRDVIEVHLDIAGYKVILADTAGLREAGDEIEAEGVRRALARAETADLRLVLFDGSEWPRRDVQSQMLLRGEALAVISKYDLLEPDAQLAAQAQALCISTKMGQGVNDLLAWLEERITSVFSSKSAAFITRARHRTLLSEALEHSRRAGGELPMELKCEELRLAALAIGKITGKIQVDDVLDVIFRQFCIGK